MEGYRAIRSESDIPLGLERREEVQHLEKALRAVATAFLITFPSACEAVDFKDTSWQGGLKTIYEKVFDKNEHAAMSISIGDPKRFTRWTNGTEGIKDHATVDQDHTELQMLKDWITIQKAQIEADKNKVRVCHTHTHPNSFKEGYLNGPSVDDLLTLMNFQVKLNEYEEGSQTESVGLALERMGGWYFDISDPQKAYEILSKMDGGASPLPEQFVQLGQLFSAKDLDVKKINDLLDVIESTLYSMGIAVRYVPIQDLTDAKKEPPCAGPYYQPPTQQAPSK